MMKLQSAKKTDYALNLLGYVAGASLAYYLLKKDDDAPKTPLRGLAGGAFAPIKKLTDITNNIKRVGRDLGTAFNWAASLVTNVPAWLIHITVANEIGHYPYTRTNPHVGATGPGQITPPTLYGIYHFAYTWGLLTPTIDAAFKSALGRAYARFRMLAVKGSPISKEKTPADFNAVMPALKNPQFNVLAAGLLLSCLTRMYSNGTHADPAWVMLTYYQGIEFGILKIRTALRLSRTAMIKRIAQPEWRFPASLVQSPQQLQRIALVDDGRDYIANHLAPGGFFEQIQKLGYTPQASM